MPLSKIVARYQDGRVAKGHTGDFLPSKPAFHLLPTDARPGAKPLEVRVGELKAVFFVKDYAGDPDRRDVPIFPVGEPVVGRKLRVTFRDGETIVGTTQGYDPKRPGFFLQMVDPEGNNERCFVVAAATAAVEVL